MDIIFRQAVRVDEVRVDGVIAEGACGIVDHVLWIDQIPARETLHRATVLPLEHARVPGGLEIRWESGKWFPVSSQWWRLRWKSIFDRKIGRIGARIDTEVGGLIHINPQCIDVDARRRTEESVELIIPVVLSAGGKPIRESCHSRPNNTWTSLTPDISHSSAVATYLDRLSRHFCARTRQHSHPC